MGNKKTVLIVEDEEVLADIYVTKFNLEGYDTLLATDGITAVDLALHKKPDLILLDIVMPKKNGYEILKELKSSSKTKGTPIIILSNLGQDYEVKRGISLGADKYLIKAEYTPAQVVEEVRKMIK